MSRPDQSCLPGFQIIVWKDILNLQYEMNACFPLYIYNGFSIVLVDENYAIPLTMFLDKSPWDYVSYSWSSRSHKTGSCVNLRKQIQRELYTRASSHFYWLFLWEYWLVNMNIHTLVFRRLLTCLTQSELFSKVLLFQFFGLQVKDSIHAWTLDYIWMGNVSCTKISMHRFKELLYPWLNHGGFLPTQRSCLFLIG